ncbi:MAG: AzlD domain-containing protein [Lachnospiraceae bacterium]|nr:AzlD domain-containing protein [Lachnospiraceae bacterium]
MLRTLILILVMSAMTFLTRAIPFILFREGKETPKAVTYLGKVLPYSLIAMLVVYCLKDMDIAGHYHGAAEIIATLYVIIVHKKWHNLLISIGGGTLLYMILVQVVFT